MFFNTIVFRFVLVLASENNSKIELFSHFFRKRRFCENRAPVEAPCIFSGFGASQNRPKIDAKTRSKKASEKNVPKLDFGLRFGLPNRPNMQKNLKRCVLKKAPKKQPWKLPDLPQTTARQAFWDPANPSNHLSND